MSGSSRHDQQARREDGRVSAACRYRSVTSAAKATSPETSKLLNTLERAKSLARRAQLSHDQLEKLDSLQDASSNLSASAEACLSLSQYFETPPAEEVSSEELHDIESMKQQDCKEKANRFLRDHEALIKVKQDFLESLTNGKLTLRNQGTAATVFGIGLLIGGTVSIVSSLISEPQRTRLVTVGVVATSTGLALVLTSQYNRMTNRQSEDAYDLGELKLKLDEHLDKFKALSIH